MLPLQRSETVYNANQPSLRVPRCTNELKERVQYARGLLAIANKFNVLGERLDKVDEAYRKAGQAQEGLYYYNDPLAMAKNLKKKIAFFDRETGTLTVSKKGGMHYQIGQELPLSVKTGTNKAQIAWYFWDKKANTVQELTSEIVFYDQKKDKVIHYNNATNMYLFNEKFLSENKIETLSVVINKINALTKEELKGFNSSIPERVPLFNILDEQAKIHQKPLVLCTQTGECSPILKKWQDESLIDPTIEEIENVDPNHANGNIYIFGTYSDIPTYGVFGQVVSFDKAFGVYGSNDTRPMLKDYDEKYPGNKLKLSEKNLQEIGRTKANNFLSNSYRKDLIIPGEAKIYRSVTHYLLQKRIENCLEAMDGKPSEEMMQNLEALQAKIEGSKNAKLAHHYYCQFTQRIPNLLEGYNMDNELKKALFYKFAEADGKPNEEGRKLLSTGIAQLYAGHEIGDPSYGMIFVNFDKKTNERRMEGSNKLGKCLMELREILREEKKSNISGSLISNKLQDNDRCMEIKGGAAYLVI